MYQPKTITKTFAVLFSCLFFLVACGGGGSSSESGPNSPVSTAVQDYRHVELDFIDTELRNSHPDMFFSKSQNQYELDYAALREASLDMPVTQFRVELAKFVADLGDQHTYITLPFNEMKKFPVKIWWEGDRAIVIETDSQHQRFLGQELLSIDGTPVAFLKDPAMEYLAYQNDYWKDALSPTFLHLAAVLENEGVIASTDLASFEFEDTQGIVTQVDVPSRIFISDWIRIEDTHEAPPLYRLSVENYAYTVDEELLYIQYNSAFDVFGYPLSDFVDDLERQMENTDIDKVVVDLRFNYGGRINHFVPVINALASSQFNEPDKLFVLTGRNSFSSAVGAIYSFQELTEATFVGEPSGGKPNGFSYVLGWVLPTSGSVFYLSTSYLEITTEDVDSFYPDHQVLITQQDFIAGEDPVVNFVRDF